MAFVAHARLHRGRHEIERAMAFAQDATVHDPLTGLANRKGLAMLGAQIMETARRRGDAVYCMFLDVDGLARVNTELGHASGDEVLLTVAEALTTSTRATDAVARWGDDEFVVVGPGTGLAPLEMERRVRARCLENSPVPRERWGGPDQRRWRRPRAVGRRRRRLPAASGRPRDAPAARAAPRGGCPAVPSGAAGPEPQPAGPSPPARLDRLSAR